MVSIIVSDFVCLLSVHKNTQSHDRGLRCFAFGKVLDCPNNAEILILHSRLPLLRARRWEMARNNLSRTSLPPLFPPLYSKPSLTPPRQVPRMARPFSRLALPNPSPPQTQSTSNLSRPPRLRTNHSSPNTPLLLQFQIRRHSHSRTSGSTRCRQNNPRRPRLGLRGRLPYCSLVP